MYRILLIALTIVTSQAFAWGGRGHAVICEVAPFLVKNPKLKEFLTFRPQVMAHLCNTPDIHWKSISKEITEAGSPAHYIDPEITGLAVKDVPLDFAAIQQTYTGKPNLFDTGKTITNIPKEMGSLWWRADQFMRIAADLKDTFEGAKPPIGREQEQDYKLPYNQGTYQWMLAMGLMGHFVGDASMPYHSSADHDGWKAGHGGIHFYYEDLVVSAFDGDLHTLVLKKARELAAKPKTQPYMKGNTLERMKALSVISSSEIAKVSKVDPILKKSSIIEESGKPKKVAAERKPASEGLKAFRSLIVEQMARSVLLLATLWDESYTAVGSPDLSKYRSYQFPFTPDFVPLDYVDVKEIKKASNP